MLMVLNIHGRRGGKMSEKTPSWVIMNKRLRNSALGCEDLGKQGECFSQRLPFTSIKIVLQTYGCWGEGCGKGMIREFGMDMYPQLYLKQITNKDLLYLYLPEHMELCSVLCGSLDGRGLWKIYLYVWLGPLAVYLKWSQCLLIGYTPVQNKMFKNKLKNFKLFLFFAWKLNSPNSFFLPFWPRCNYYNFQKFFFCYL